MSRSFRSRLLLLVLTTAMVWASWLTLAPGALAGVCLARPWPWERSELAPDPALRFGRLDNGLRYLIIENSEPRGRVGLYLNIQAGSLHEREDQRGLAHFMEHMSFNGSTHFPPDALVDYFQSIGMQFGADSNAHTGYEETVYNVFLPSATREQIERGLLVLADFARGALLLPEEVDSERGVILAEKRARDTVAYRVYEARTQFLLGGTLAPERLPIGTEEVIRGADQARLQGFYNAWYRPENMVLVAVGEVAPTLLEELIRARFAPLVAAGVPSPCPAFGRVDEDGLKTLVLYEPELGHTEVVLETVWNQEVRPQSPAGERQRIEEMVAVAMLRHRLAKLVRQEGGPLVEASAQSDVHLRRIGYGAVTAQTVPGRWREGLRLLGTTLHQALEYGFTPAELARAQGELRAHLEAQVQTRPSRDSRKLVMEIIRTLNEDEVFMSPEQELAMYGALIEQLDPAATHEALRRIWAHPARRVQVVGNTQLHPDPDEARRLLAEAWQGIAGETVAKPALTERAVFPYLPVPQQLAPVSSREELKSIGATRLCFANGLILNLKRTDFRRNEVLAALHFGDGRLGEAKPGLALLAEAVVNDSGVGRLEQEELQEALAGRNLDLRFQVGTESFALTGKALTDELELLLQLMATRLRDPAFRSQAHQQVLIRLRQAEAKARASAEGQLLLAGERFYAGGNSRYGLPSLAEFERITLEDIRGWLTPVFAASSLELTLVGDFDPERVEALVGRHLATLPGGGSPTAHGAAIAFPAGGRLDLRAETNIDRALVSLAFPTADFWNIGRTRRLLVLSALLDDILRREIRERLGAAYSPTVVSIPSRVDPGFGLLRAELLVEPGRAEELLGELRRVVGVLATEGVDEARLKQVREPILTQLKDLMRNNRYWLDSVLTLSSRHPQQLEWPLTIQGDFAAIDAGAISELARRYLVPDKAAAIIVWPRKGEE